MNVKSLLKILTGLCLMLNHKCQCVRIVDEKKQMPGPDISALRDDIEYLPNSNYILPAVMQCLHYYTEMMQYEQLQNPSSPSYQQPMSTTAKPRPSTTQTTTERTTTTTMMTTTPTTTTQRTTRRTKPTTTTELTTTQRPTTLPTTSSSYPELPYVTEIDIWHHHPTTAQPNKPGVTAPNKPPYFIYFDIPLKPSQGYHKPGVQRPPVDAIGSADWKDPAFFDWFFQAKPKDIEPFDENELQRLDPLPKKLLLQIHRESSHPIAILDIDNVNEFRKKYDDSFYPKYRRMNPNMQQMRMKMKIQMQQKRQTLTGRKKAPPTRPYVHMLMLYDQLKKEAKEKKLHMFMGHSPALLLYLHETSKYTGDYQIKTLLQDIVDRKEVTTPTVLSRVNFILSDLNNTNSETTKTLRSIPPLFFDL